MALELGNAVAGRLEQEDVSPLQRLLHQVAVQEFPCAADREDVEVELLVERQVAQGAPHQLGVGGDDRLEQLVAFDAELLFGALGLGAKL